ncbi:unnamed protein product, partial [Anisakis simplex]|uniref:Metalloendopeptidase n=1 Tax=Anisakis simplex TaxID=6269 RepID=A0A0M3JY18_ANISI
SNFIAHDGAVNDYAEVRNILNQYYKITARKFGSFHDYVSFTFIYCLDSSYVIKDPKHVNVALQGTSFDDGTEASTNRKEGVAGDLFENDILLTLPQAQQLLREVRKRGPRQAQVGLQWFWPAEPISFTFAVYEPKWQNLIRRALRYVESETCMRFQENRNSRDYIQFIRGAGCWSSVGRVGGRQQISIGYGCEAGIEVCFIDSKEAFIRIMICSFEFHGLQGNFEKRSSWNTDNMGEPYDLGSVMHYGSKAFAIDYSRDTIRTIDRNFQRTIGQRGGMSFKDIKMINKRYCQCTLHHLFVHKHFSHRNSQVRKLTIRINFSDVCSPLPCQNGGYTNPNKCSECKCPKGYGGRYCERIETSGTSPAQVLVVVDHLNLPCEETCTNYVELKYANEKTSTGPRLCCMAPTASFISEGNEFIVIFNTANVDTRYQGMKIRYQACALQGPWYEDQPCGLTPCPDPIDGTYCEGKIVLPCDLMDRLKFGAAKYSSAVFNTLRYCNSTIVSEKIMDHEFHPAKSKDVIEEAYYHRLILFDGSGQLSTNSQDCNCVHLAYFRRFWYSCPTSMLTINIAWLRPGEVNHNIRGCCSGYYVSEGICKKTN